MSEGEFKAHGITTARAESLRLLEPELALLMYENGVTEPYAESVRVGHVQDIQLEASGWLSFHFSERGKVPRKLLWELRFRIGIDPWAFSRTHWAVKDGHVHPDVLAHMIETPKQYEVALSYAGEDRGYVDSVAQLLKAHGVEVFYDQYEEVTLWGKNLALHFEQLFRQRARYCLMFVSSHYAEKVWPRHEATAAIARAMLERSEYILPVKLDDTDVPGLSPLIGYRDARLDSPEKIAGLLLQKLGRQ